MNERFAFLSSYMPELIELDVPQFELLSSNRFVDFLRARNIRLSEEELEHFERIGFLYPVLRLRRPKIQEADKHHYAGILETSWMWKEYLHEGMLEFPDPTNFRSWNAYKDGYEDNTFIYYHPYQVFLIERFFSLSSLTLTSPYIEEATDCRRMFEQAKKMHERVKESFLRLRPGLIRQIGLLLSLQNAYQPDYRGRILLTFEKDSFDKWRNWRTNRFSAPKTLKESKMQIEEVINMRNYFAAQAAFTDPLSDWYPLVRLVQPERKHKLKNKALLAQDYYEIVGILNLFLKDLTNEEQLDPDDVLDGRQGKWKSEYYGRKFDYNDKEIQRRIVSSYLNVEIPKAILLVEGYSEETAINILMDALRIIPERQGISIHNFEGTGGITLFNASAVLKIAIDQGVGRYLIIDNDQNAKELVEELLKQKLLDSDCYKIWDTDFEQDNFGINTVIEAVNEQIVLRGLSPIKTADVGKRMTEHPHERLWKVIHDECWLMNHVELESLVSKKSLARLLSTKRAVEISREINENQYKPKWKIEEEILKFGEKFCP